MEKEKLDLIKSSAKRGNILVLGNINKDLIDVLEEEFIRLNNSSRRKEIKVLIDSSGGGGFQAARFYDLLTLSTAPVTTITFGNCESAALYIFQSGRERMATPNSSFLLHHGNFIFPDWGLYDKDIEEKFNIHVKETRKGKDNARLVIMKRCGISLEKIKELEEAGEKGYWLSAQEAKKLNLIDKIIYKMPIL